MIEIFPSQEIVLVVGSWPIHWYGFLYVLSFGLALYLLPKLQKYRGLKLRFGDWLEVMAWAVGGVVVGGRLGFVLLYEPAFFLHNPIEIFGLSGGGMSSHGGFVGVAVTVFIASRVLSQRVPLPPHYSSVSPASGGAPRNFVRSEPPRCATRLQRIMINMLSTRVRTSSARAGESYNGTGSRKKTSSGRHLNREGWKMYLRVMDVVIVPVAIGLALGRVGNVINQELFGSIVVQVMAVAKNVFIAGGCYWYLRSRRSKGGQVVALFLILYGLLRFLIEFVRIQDYAEVWNLTRGQWYTVPIIVVGIVLWLYVHKTCSRRIGKGYFAILRARRNRKTEPI